jgi:RHS repeat-associated protein
MVRRCLAAVMVTVLLLPMWVAVASPVSADPVNPILDQSWGSGGLASVPLANEFSGAITSGPLGFVYAAGVYRNSSNTRFLAVTRFNASGGIDSTYGASGTATFPLTGSSFIDELIGLSDGTVLALVGERLIKLDINGDPASGFGIGGSVVLAGPGAGLCGYSPLGSVAVGPSGEIVVGGYANVCATANLQSVLGKLLPDGAMDPGFDGDGWRTWVSPDTTFGLAYVEGISPDSRILVRGACPGGRQRVCKFLSDGQPDPGFTEVQSIGANDIQNAVLTSANGFFMVQFEDRVRFYFADGQLNYYAQTRFLEVDEEGQEHRQWAVMPNGAAFVRTSSFGLWRYTSNASLDYTWSDDARDNSLQEYVLDVAAGTDVGGRAVALVLNGSSMSVARLARQDRSFAPLPPERATGDQPGSESIGDPVDTATGNFHDVWTDLTTGVFGLDVMRSYNSLRTDPGSMGPGWWAGVGPTVAVGGADVIVTEPDGTRYRYVSDGAGGYIVPDGTSSIMTVDPAAPSGGGTLPMLRRTSADGVVDRFDTAGRLVEQINWDGEWATSTYIDGRLSTVDSSTGLALSFLYDPSGLLTEVNSSTGRTVTYAYVNGQLTTETDEFGATTTFEYTASTGLLATVLDPAGFYAVVNEYDPDNRVIRQTGPTGGVLSFAYAPSEGVTEVTDSVTGTTLVYHHDEAGRVVAITDAYGNTALRNFDDQGRQTSGISRGGVAATATYDNRDNPTEIVDAATGTTQFSYDELNRTTSVLAPSGATTTFAYTATGRIPTTITDTFGNATTQVVSNGLVTSITDADGVTLAYTYDSERRPATVADELGNVTTYTYNAEGRPLTVTSPEGEVTAWAYDAAGRVESTIAADGGVTTYTYDAAGRVLTITDPAGAVTTNEYTIDVNGQPEPYPYLTRTTTPDGAVTTYTYDPHGNLLSRELSGATDTTVYGPLTRVESTTDALGRSTTYNHNDDGAVTSSTGPDEAVTSTTYDAAGRVAATTDAMGRTTTVTYDAAGRVENAVLPGGATNTYTYDLLGRVVAATDARGGVTTTSYTPGGRIASTTDTAGLQTEFDYDAAGRQISSTLPNGGVSTSVLDGEGRPTLITTPEGLETSYTYDPMGRITTITDPAGVTTQRTWSLRGELVTERIGSQGTTTMTCTSSGALSSVTDQRSATTTFVYDQRGNLIERINALGHSDTWTYDLADQLTSRTDALGRTTTYAYDAAGRLAQSIDPSGVQVDLTHAADGRIASRADGVGTTTYSYDDAGRLLALVGPDGSVTYTYSLAGDVLSRDVNGRLTTWAYDAAGWRTSMRYPSGESINYAYDSAGRLSTIRPGELVGDSFTQTQPDLLTSKWSVTLAGTAVTAVVDNSLHMDVLDVAGDAATVASRVAASADSDIAFTYAFGAGQASGASTLTAYTRYSTNNHYRLEFSPGATSATLVQKKGAAVTTLGTIALPSGADTVRVRLQVIGTQIRVRLWPSEGTEPGVWAATFTGTLTTTGTARLSLTRASAASTAVIDDWTQSNPSATPAALASYTYNLDGQTLQETLIGGTRVRAYVDGRLSTYTQSLPGNTTNTALTYDSTGRLATDTNGGVTTTYGYDAASQLLSTTPSTGTATTWTYDLLGRRTSQRQGTATTNYVYDPAGQLCWTRPTALPASPNCAAPPTNGTVYQWDAAGRLRSEFRTSTNQVTYTHDAAGRVASVERINGTTTTTHQRAYEPDGLLGSVQNSKTTATTTTNTSTLFDWDPLNGLPRLSAWTDSTGITTDFISGPGGWVAQQKGLSGNAIALNAQGSAVPGTGTTAVARNAVYDAFGVANGAATFEPRLGYRGELTIDTTVYLRARNYSPARGAFGTTDQVEGRPGTPTITYRYHYADNNPLNRFDPTGLSSSGTDSTFDPSLGLVAAVARASAPALTGASTLTATAASGSGGFFAAAGATTGGAAVAVSALVVVGGVAIGCWIACDEYFEMKEYEAQVQEDAEYLAERMHVNGLVAMPSGVGAPPRDPNRVAVCNVDESGDDLDDGRTNLHHGFPRFLGGPASFPGPNGGNAALVEMPRSSHVQLHNDLNDFLDPLGMRPTCINPGLQIQRDYTKDERMNALKDFYRGPGARYADAARHFFNNLSNPNFVAAVVG